MTEINTYGRTGVILLWGFYTSYPREECVFRAQSTDGLAREKGAIGMSDRPEVCSRGKGSPSQVRIRDIYVCRKSE